MAETTTISWTDKTHNEWIGCMKVGPGCDICYAEALMGNRMGRVEWGAPGKGVGTRSLTSESNRRLPLKWNKQAASLGIQYKVFCSSLSDVFDKEVPAEWRRGLAKTILATPNLIWQLLTKRIGNAGDMLSEMFPEGVPPNVWLGATVVNQEEADRDWSKLKAAKDYHSITRAFLSIEPMLGPIDLHLYAGWIDWIIVGGESGGKLARPMHPDWVRKVRDFCLSFNVPFLFKQWGSCLPCEWLVGETGPNSSGWIYELDPDCCELDYDDLGKGWMVEEHGMEFVRFSHKKTGDFLDGSRHHEFPL